MGSSLVSPGSGLGTHRIIFWKQIPWSCKYVVRALKSAQLSISVASRMKIKSGVRVWSALIGRSSPDQPHVGPPPAFRPPVSAQLCTVSPCLSYAAGRWSPAQLQTCPCLAVDAIGLYSSCRLTSQLDVNPASSLCTFLRITGTCLALVILTRANPAAVLWIDFLA